MDLKIIIEIGKKTHVCFGVPAALIALKKQGVEEDIILDISAEITNFILSDNQASRLKTYDIELFMLKQAER